MVRCKDNYSLIDKSITYTNWGITSDEFEPRASDECVQMCFGGSDCGDGSWKTTACSTSLSYICEVPCTLGLHNIYVLEGSNSNHWNVYEL